MTIGQEIAGAQTALAPEQAAEVIIKTLFDHGANRLSSVHRALAKGTITAGLYEWRKQLLAAAEDGAAKWKKKYTEAKAELDEVKLRLAVFEKEK